MIINMINPISEIIVILYKIPLFIMRPIVQTYKVGLYDSYVCFAASGLIITNVGLFASALTTNQTGSNMTTTAGGGGRSRNSKQAIESGYKGVRFWR